MGWLLTFRLTKYFTKQSPYHKSKRRRFSLQQREARSEKLTKYRAENKNQLVVRIFEFFPGKCSTVGVGNQKSQAAFKGNPRGNAGQYLDFRVVHFMPFT
jgi:hypothetical protein